MPKAIKRTESVAAKIRKYVTENPHKTVPEVAAACGVKYQRAYVVKKDMEKKLSELPKVGDTLGGLVFTRLNNGRFRWLPPATVPMPEPKQVEMPVTMEEPEADPVNHPAHYKVGGIETIDFIEAKRLNYNMGNAVKYITRADHKGSRKQDLEKAIWYLRREVEHSV